MKKRTMAIVVLGCLIVGCSGAIFTRAWKNNKELEKSYEEAVEKIRDENKYVASLNFSNQINSVSDAQQVKAKTTADITILADIENNYVKCSGTEETLLNNITTGAESKDKSSFCIYGLKEADVYYRYLNSDLGSENWKKTEETESIIGKEFLKDISELKILDSKRRFERSKIIVSGNVRGKEIANLIDDITSIGAGNYYINPDIITNLNSIKCKAYINRSNNNFSKIEFDFGDAYREYMGTQSLDATIDDYKLSITFVEIGNPIEPDFPKELETVEISEAEVSEEVESLPVE